MRPMFAFTAAILFAAAPFAQGQQTAIDNALALSKKTGRPVLAVVGKTMCSHCEALQQRLTGDRSVTPLVAEFVPLKLEASDKAGMEWCSKLRSTNSTYPIIFIVRADGEQLFGAGASTVPGNDLPKLLQLSLKSSGRSLSEAEVKILSQCVAEAKQALAAGSNPRAAVALSRVATLAAGVELKSYAEAAQEANQLTRQVIEAAEKSVAEAKEQLAQPAAVFEGLLTLLEGERAYTALPGLKSAISPLLQAAERDAELAEVYKQATAIDRVRRLPLPSLKSKAVAGYLAIAKRFPETPAEKLALEELARLDPKQAETVRAAAPSEPATSTPTAAEFRVWTSGSFTVEAKYLQQKQGFVQLEKRDGKQISVPLEKLSQADQDFLKQVR